MSERELYTNSGDIYPGEAPIISAANGQKKKFLVKSKFILTGSKSKPASKVKVAKSAAVNKKIKKGMNSRTTSWL